MNEPINTFAPELEPLTQRLYKLLFAGGINSARVDTNYLTQETNIDLIRTVLQTAYELGIDTCVPRMYSEEQERQLNDMNINDHIYSLDEDINNTE